MIEVKEPFLYYEEMGSGPAGILIHGGQLDLRMWEAQLPPLASQHRVVRYDVRGYGRSEEPHHAYSDVDDLLALMDSLKLDRAVLIGLSLGGRIAIDFILVHPERVAALVLSGPGMSGHAWSQEAAAEYGVLLKAAQAGPDRATAAWLANPYMAPAMENPALAVRLRELSSANARVWLSNPLFARDLDPPAAGRLSEIKVPTLALIGSRDVPDIRAIVKRIGERVAGARTVEVKGGSPGGGTSDHLPRPDVREVSQRFRLTIGHRGSSSPLPWERARHVIVS